MQSRVPIFAAIKGRLRAQLKSDFIRLLVRQASAVYLAQIASFAIQFATGLLLGRQLGASSYGLYALAISIVVVARIAASIGLPTMLMRYAASYLATKDWGHLKGLLQFALLSFLGCGPIVAGLLGGGVLLLSPHPLPPISTLILLSLPLLLILPTFEGSVNVIKGLQRFGRSQLPDLFKASVFLLLLLATIGLGGRLQAHDVMLMRIAADGGGMLLAAAMVFAFLPREVLKARPAFAPGQWTSGLLSFLAIDGMYLVYQQTDVLMLGLLRPPADVGVYRMATNIALVLLFLSSTAAGAMSPHIASAWASGERGEVRHACTQMARFATAGSVALYAAILLATPFFIYLLGPDFAGLMLPLSIIGIGHLARATTSPAINLTVMTGAERTVALGVAASAVLNLILNLALIPVLGMVGSAISTTLCQIGLAVYYAVRGYQRTGIDGSIFGRHSSAAMKEGASGEAPH